MRESECIPGRVAVACPNTAVSIPHPG